MTTFKPSRPLEYQCQLRIQYTDSRPDKIIPYVTKTEAFNHIQWIFHEEGVGDFVVEDYEPDNWKSVGEVVQGICEKMGKKCQETE